MACENDGGYQVALLKIPVAEVERSATFYCDVLGFEPQFVAEEYGWAQLSADGLDVALYVPGQGGGDGPIGGSVGFHLTLAPVRFDPLAQALLARGALSENQVHTGNDGTAFIDVSDPDGNVLKILRSAGDAAD